jgi:hypothetical protein
VAASGFLLLSESLSLPINTGLVITFYQNAEYACLERAYDHRRSK